MASSELWLTFFAFMIFATFVDLRSANEAKEMTSRRALLWSALWVSLAGVFCAGLYCYGLQVATPKEAGEWATLFVTGYVLEKALAVDNLFVFLMIFQHFKVPTGLRPRALMLGVLCAVVLRCLMIMVGAALIHSFHWILYFFGAFLLWTAWKMWKPVDSHEQPDLLGASWMSRLPLSQTFAGNKLWLRVGGKLQFTQLFVVFMVLGVTDLIFAMDSIPAVFAITEDPFLVMTSNIFAVMGLRALFFLLASWVARFVYLSKALSLVLAFIGGKMLLAKWVVISVGASLGVIATILVGAVLLSWQATQSTAGVFHRLR